jgi:adenosylcobinamide-GDP ribazoletransferase
VTRRAGPGGSPLDDALGAAQFLTRVPIRRSRAPTLARCVPWFPFIGSLIGAVVGAITAGLLEVVPAPVAAVVGVLAGVMITGAFHEDGLADTADAMGGWTPEQRREILKDSRHGSYGVAALCGSIVLRVACVASLGPAVAFGGLVAAHTLGRASAVATMTVTAPPAVEGLGADFMRTVRRGTAWVGVAVGLAITVVAVGWWSGPLALAAVLVTVPVAVVARRALGGVTGDVLGAIEQVAECTVLVVVSGLALHHPIWWS